jgi:hypothetical protein
VTGWSRCRKAGCGRPIWFGPNPRDPDRVLPYDDETEERLHFETCGATEWVTDDEGDRHSVSKCSACGARVWWQTTYRGKRRPMDIDGDVASWDCHFDTCPGERTRTGPRPEPEPVYGRARTEPPPPPPPPGYSRRMPGSKADWMRDLELSPPLSLDQLKSAFRALAMRHHPDMGGQAHAFIRIKWAYDHLKEYV